MMEAKKKYEKPAFRLVTDLGSILECLYEVYGTARTCVVLVRVGIRNRSGVVLL